MASDADDKVYLDFADVPFISLSFADEFINKLMREVGLVTFIKKRYCESVPILRRSN